MKRTAILLAIILLLASLFSGCDELFDANMLTERNPYIPTSGTPVPEPNAPLLKTPVPTTAQPTEIPTETPTEVPTEVPVTSTNPKPAPSETPTQMPTQAPTAEPVPSESPEPTIEPTPVPTLIPPVEYIPKLGILTDSSTIIASAMSSMAVNGLKSVAAEYSYESVIMEVPAMDKGTIMAHIDILVNNECEVILLPGEGFSDALESAHTLYPETLFVLIGYDGIIGKNVITVLFSEFQAGFLAGTASAVEISSALGITQVDFGIIIEEDTVSAQLYAAGFTEGLLYAANTYGIDAQIPQQYIIYLEFQDDPEEALYAAYGLFDSGVECILNLAGSSASQVVQAAIDFTDWGTSCFLVGVEYDSFLEGLLPDGSSVILTSAMTFYDVAVNDIITDYAAGDFAGGTQRLFDQSTGGIGLTPGNPGLSADTISTLSDIYDLMDLNWLVVPPLGDGSVLILAPPPIPVPTLPPVPSEIPTLPPSPTIPPLP